MPYLKLLENPFFFELLLVADGELAAQVQRGGCVLCGGPLHVANYPRKPRQGTSVMLPAGYARRFSFCCGSCRRRKTPASVRFLGRRVYLGAVVVLLTAMMQGVTPRRATELHRLFGVGLKTLARWRAWWLEAFPQTQVWVVLRGLLIPPVLESQLPHSLVQRMSLSAGEAVGLHAVLARLRPLTTGSGGAMGF